ncbi:MAG: sialate O-acetylesterase [Erysipelotrichaceae bacterium]|nr:sialate O-acetylesterase [Erysipelotrichaceae bacterium]
MGLSVNKLFSDNMVLQRDVVFYVSGKGEPGMQVRVKIQNQEQSAVVAGNSWRVAIGPLKTGFCEELVIEANGDTIKFKNVAVGDVFLLAGQSNIEFEFYQSAAFKNDLPYCKNNGIRYLEIPRIEYRKDGRAYPDLKTEPWAVCDQETAPAMSAVGLYFAHFLNRDKNIPIGLISMNKGGSSASCWISETYLKKDDSVFKKYWLDYYEGINDQSDSQEDEARAKYNLSLNQYLTRLEEYHNLYPERSTSQMKKDLGHTPWPPPKGKRDAFRPSGLYDMMFKLVKDFRFKSVIYYQGEEDTRHGEIYKRLLSLLIENWREDFQNEVPFVIVALPEYNDDKNDKWSLVRDAQGEVCANHPGAYLVVSLNCGEEFNIHPQEKVELAYRIFARVKEAFYDHGYAGHAPCIVKTAVQNGILTLGFDQNIRVAGPIEILEDGKAVESVTTDGNNLSIAITPGCLKVEYCHQNYCKSHIVGRNNLPIAGFEIDLARLNQVNRY